MAMRSVRSDSFLWIHGAGLAAVPLLLELCWLGLAAGDPLLPWGLDWLPVAIAGAVPVLAVQWGRPFYPFAIAGLTLRPAALEEVRLRILQRWRAWPIKAIAAVGAIALVGALGFLYRWAAIASDVTPFGPRWQGLLVAAIAFLVANLLAQMGLASLWVALTPTATLAQLDPVAADTIDATFTRLGVPLSRLLPLLDGFEEKVPLAEAPETEEAIEPEAVMEPAEAAIAAPETGTEPEPAMAPDLILDDESEEEEGDDTLIAIAVPASQLVTEPSETPEIPEVPEALDTSAESSPEVAPEAAPEADLGTDAIAPSEAATTAESEASDTGTDTGSDPQTPDSPEP
ncbi:MAG: low-complexity tail membrane protein [Cyanobacteria bacterium]|nr:low-complexity tail membrane protein [Cyanobacteriota bacterium]